MATHCWSYFSCISLPSFADNVCCDCSGFGVSLIIGVAIPAVLVAVILVVLLVLYKKDKICKYCLCGYCYTFMFIIILFLSLIKSAVHISVYIYDCCLRQQYNLIIFFVLKCDSWTKVQRQVSFSLSTELTYNKNGQFQCLNIFHVLDCSDI